MIFGKPKAKPLAIAATPIPGNTAHSSAAEAEKTTKVIQREGKNGLEAANAAPPGRYQGVDAETARYLDSSIVIDEQKNRKIKRMVRLGPSPQVSSCCRADGMVFQLDKRILPFLVITYFFQTCQSLSPLQYRGIFSSWPT